MAKKIKTPKKRIFFNAPGRLGYAWVSNSETDLEYFHHNYGGDLRYRRKGNKYTIIVPADQILRIETTANYDKGGRNQVK